MSFDELYLVRIVCFIIQVWKIGLLNDANEIWNWKMNSSVSYLPPWLIKIFINLSLRID